MFWFLRKKISQAVQKVVPPHEPMDDETLAKVLDVVNNKLHWALDWKLDKPWSVIPPVSCPHQVRWLGLRPTLDVALRCQRHLPALPQARRREGSQEPHREDAQLLRMK